MKTAWLSYSWADNEGPNEGTVDYLVQEIERQGVSIRLDKRNLVVGQPLWPQIEKYISDPALSDAWVFVVAPGSLSSKPCKEELLYALDRALDKRAATFPLIGLFQGPVPDDLPKALKVRLCVSTDEANWAARVAAGIRQETAHSSPDEVRPYVAHLCNTQQAGGDHVFEVRPRVGLWVPFVFGVREADAHRIKNETYAPSSGPMGQCIEGHCSGSMCSPMGEFRENGWVWRGVMQPVLSAGMAAHISLFLGGQTIQLKFGVRGGTIHTATLAPYRP